MKKFLLPLSIFAFCLLSITASAQLETPQPSPGATLIQKVGLAEVKIEYSRPSMKGRKIFGGDVIPYGEMWRLGANSATKITISDSITIKGKGLAKGSYVVMAKPGKDSWDIIFNKNPAVSVFNYKPEDDVVTVNVPSMALAKDVQSFTINIANVTNTSAEMEFSWEKTMVSVPFTNDVDSKVMAQIKSKLDGISQGDYFAMSQYYFETGKDLAQTLDFVNKALAKGERFWMLRHKSLVQAKMGDKKGAIETAKKSLAAAQEAKNPDYIRMNEKSITEWTKM
jgi:Protein of unknown function (DUF2911)